MATSRKKYSRTKQNDRHSRLVAIEHVKGMPGQFWKFKCDCGNEHIAASKLVRSGNTQSCGCLKYENSKRQNRRTHGRSYTPEHRAWASIKSRCYNERSDDYARYGGRGIKVCDRWVDSFELFFLDMGMRPSPGHSIDRYPDNDGNYEPSNCRWATVKEQANNRHNSRFIEVNGKKLPLKEAAVELGIKYQTLFWRLKHGRDLGSNARVI